MMIRIRIIWIDEMVKLIIGYVEKSGVGGKRRL